MIKRLHSNLYFVKDIKNTAEFYRKLGFDVAESEDAVRIKPGDFTLVFMDESKVQIDKEAGVNPKGIGIFTYVEVDDVDEQFSSIKESGIVPSSEPKDWPWGKREFAVKDPDGYKIIFYSSIR
ncbi:MAG: VOC family protein [Candidatus Colwellbacteria bacterium]|nr:VOC family protein [Candidatus Colwellbacteria bacterium]